jgi:hypothetical protein
MAIRNSPANRVPGNPLAGILQQTARKARSTSRRSSVPGPQGPAGPPASATGPHVVLAGVYRTDATGVASVSFPSYTEDAVVTAVAMGPSQVSVTVADVSIYGAMLVARGLDGVAVPNAVLHVAVFAPEPETAVPEETDPPSDTATVD